MRQNEEYLLLLAQCCELHGETIGILAMQYHALLQSLESKEILREIEVDEATKKLLQKPVRDELQAGLENLREAIEELKKRLSQ